jgi:uncharacterized protein (TIGR02646 family)
LGRYRHGVDTWGGGCPTQPERQAIWEKLDAMQGERCAYCEAQTSANNRHIEHFRQRGRFPQGTFDWANLFGSCMRSTSCGKHKDSCGMYDPQHLIKPDIEDPEHFLVFAPTGAVSPREGLSSDELRRATETIRILNLDAALEQIRHREVSGYVQTAEQFAEFAEHFPETEWMPLLQQELQNIEHLPFVTAIRHVLTRQSP